MSFDFHVVVHGILIVAIHQPDNAGNTGYTKIVIPYDSCHNIIAACMDFDGSVLWQTDLPNGIHTVTPVTAPSCNPITSPDSDLLLCQLKSMNFGSNTWCTIGDFPVVKPIPMRRFKPCILDSSTQTYKDNHLDVVDAAGCPSAYVLMFGKQSGGILFDSGTGLQRILPGQDNVARLHLYAEPPTNMTHDALKTLAYCIGNDFDLKASSNAPSQAIPGDTPGGVEVWEQDTLAEQQQIQISHAPPCFSMDMKKSLEDNSPRTCIPVVGGG